jgi:Family of unknown function (DUF6228)
MPLASIGSGSETLTLSAEEGRLQADELVCELRAETMSASRRVYALEFTDLAEFFEELARDWRGWTGPRAWRSLEGDLEITAEHHRHVRLRIALRGDPYRSDWGVSAAIELDRGEELSTVAADVRALVDGTPPPV